MRNPAFHVPDHSYNAALNKTSHPPRLRAALPPELKEQLKRLNSATPQGVHVTVTVDAGDALEKLRSALERAQTPVTLNTAKKICNELRRSARRTPRKLDCTIKYNDQTIRATCAVLIHLVRVSLKSMAQPEAQTPRPTKRSPQKTLQALIALGLETLVTVCEKADQDSSWKYCMEYISVVADVAKASPKELLPDSASNPAFSTIKQGLISDLTSELNNGRISEASLILASVRGYTSLRQALADSLTIMLERESAKLPVNSQEWVLKTLGVERESRQLSYANPADAPEIRQAAGLLLLLWDNSAINPVMQEAFDRFRTLCEKHFHLHLKGQSGEVADYDSRVHEVNDPGAGRVRLTRPWIEFFDPPHSAIVLRALATRA